MFSLDGWEHRPADHIGDAPLHIASLAFVGCRHQVRHLILQRVQVHNIRKLILIRNDRLVLDVERSTERELRCMGCACQRQQERWPLHFLGDF